MDIALCTMFKATLLLLAVVLAVALYEAHGYTQKAVKDCEGPTKNGDILSCGKKLIGKANRDADFLNCARATRDPATIREAEALVDCLNPKGH